MSHQTSRRLLQVVLAVWIGGFLIGTTTHVLDLVSGGWDTYSEFPLALRVFWVSLTILDPITALFLALHRRVGVILGLVVILADITMNWTVLASLGGNPLFGVVNQSVFAAFLLSTASILWRWFPARASLQSA